MRYCTGFGVIGFVSTRLTILTPRLWHCDIKSQIKIEKSVNIGNGCWTNSMLIWWHNPSTPYGLGNYEGNNMSIQNHIGFDMVCL